MVLLTLSMHFMNFLYLLTPESDHHGFTNALYALYELLYLLTPESDHHGFTNALYALYELLYL